MEVNIPYLDTMGYASICNTCRSICFKRKSPWQHRWSSDVPFGRLSSWWMKRWRVVDLCLETQTFRQKGAEPCWTLAWYTPPQEPHAGESQPKPTHLPWGISHPRWRRYPSETLKMFPPSYWKERSLKLKANKTKIGHPKKEINLPIFRG